MLGAGVKNADDRALAQMFREHADAVWRLARALGLSDAAAEDVTQETFLIVQRRWENFATGSAVRPWILGVARNVVRHHRRATSRRRARMRVVPEPPPPEAPSGAVERREAAELIQRFIAQLDAKKRDVFVLGFVEQLTPAEIAAVLNIKRATVYARAQAAETELARFAARIRLLDREVR